MPELLEHPWTWQVGPVDTAGPSLKLVVGDDLSESRPVALVGPPNGHVFPVQFLIDQAVEHNADVLEAVIRELNLYLVELGEPDPWSYALYHTGTAANLYSRVHWLVSPDLFDQTDTA
jgi:hypothetical protein